jgi:hypothetical protein
LPHPSGLDDGALDVVDSLCMAWQAARDGIDAVCATPHIRHHHDMRIGELAGRVRGRDDTVAAAGLPVRVLPGGEVAESGAPALSDEDLRRVSIGGSGLGPARPARRSSHRCAGGDDRRARRPRLLVRRRAPGAPPRRRPAGAGSTLLPGPAAP